MAQQLQLPAGLPPQDPGNADDFLAQRTPEVFLVVDGEVRYAWSQASQGLVLRSGCEADASNPAPPPACSDTVVAEEGGLTSHAAIVGLNLGIPVIVGAEGATGIITDGTIITVDGSHGLVYRGQATVK